MAPTILIADNHPATCALIARALQPQGFEVATVPDGEAALAVAAIQPPDLVMANVFLPGVDGLTVITTLRQQHPHLPVIAISAVHDVLEHPEFVPTGLDPGSIPFLAKPFGLAALIALVHHVLPLPRLH